MIGVLLTGPYTLAFGLLPGKDLMPWVTGIGILAAIQQVAKTRAFRLAGASLLSAFTDYPHFMGNARRLDFLA